MELKEINFPQKIKKPVLALGSHTKNTICFAQGKIALLSPVHADLSDPEDFLKFSQNVRYFLKKNPKVIACDLHPEYQSVKYASGLQERGYKLFPVQHHHAHIVSCMAENGIRNEKVIGVAFDGTGLGRNNLLWGAEFLFCDYKTFQRRAHLKEIPLLGQEKAIRQPWRVAAAWLYQVYREKFLGLKIDFIKKIDKEKWRVLKKMYLSGFNSVAASSMGRLFDAAASIILVKLGADFEAELAIELEKLAVGFRHPASPYDFNITKEGGEYILDPASVFRQIIIDLKKATPKEKIAYRFHLAVAEMIRKTCFILRRQTGIKKVVLSGGVFQNNLLLSLSLDLLYKEGFYVFTHKKLSSGDSGISLGQALIAGSK